MDVQSKLHLTPSLSFQNLRTDLCFQAGLTSTPSQLGCGSVVALNLFHVVVLHVASRSMRRIVRQLRSPGLTAVRHTFGRSL